MKTWNVNFVVLLLSSLGVSATGFASNYPPAYSHQTVKVLHDGPAIFAHVGSGCGSSMVIGYKLGRLLSQALPESIEAVIVGSCGHTSHGEDGMEKKTTIVRLGRDWGGNGYLSSDLSPYVWPANCYNGHVSVAFVANGVWDSMFGDNYGHFNYGLYGESRAFNTFETHESTCGGVNLKAWNYISEQLK
jgi:hypothetical protein